MSWGLLARRWEEHWFANGSSAHLGIVRLGFFAAAFALAVKDPWASTLASHPASFWRPVWIIAQVSGHPPSYATLRALELAWDAALLASAAGLFTRPATAIAAALSFYFAALQNSFGTVSHGRMPFVLATLILAASACGESVSIDAWRKRRAPAPADAARYRWPLQLVRTIWCLVFFAAGVSKLTNGGTAWVFSENLATMLLVAPHRYPEAASASVAPGLGVWIAQHPTLCVLLAAGALGSEVLAPLALLGAGWALVVVTSLAAVQIGIHLTMFENFVWFLPLYIAWLPPRSIS